MIETYAISIGYTWKVLHIYSAASWVSARHGTNTYFTKHIGYTKVLIATIDNLHAHSYKIS